MRVPRCLPPLPALTVHGSHKTNGNPSYRNHPGHYEVVLVIFDPQLTSFSTLLEYFWRNV